MPSRSERVMVAIRCCLALSVTLILSLATAGFIGTHMEATHIIAAALAAFSLAAVAILQRHRLPYLVPLAMAGGLLLVLYRPEVWETVLAVLKESVTVIAAGWAGIFTAVSPAASLTLVSTMALAIALLFLSWALLGLTVWVPGLAALSGLLAFWFYFWDESIRYTHLVFPVLAAMAASSRSLAPPRPRRLLYAVALAFLVTLTASIFPGPSATWDWGKAGDLAIEIVPGLQRFRTYGEGPTVRSGWGDGSGSLGGPLTLSPTPMLAVTLSGDYIPDALYLRGSVGTIYNGRGWEDDGEYQPFAGTRDPSPTPGRSYILTQDIRVLNISSSTLFGAWEVIQAESVGHLQVNPDISFQGSDYFKPGEEYRVVSAIPLVSAGLLNELLEDPQPLQADLERYLRLPPNIPGRVIDLTLSIVEDAGSPYQKALLLEEYLRTLPYSLEGQTLPEGRDFVDFFLFDAGEGYCVYHSTALAVMLRIAGVPSRWVEGFHLHIPAEEFGRMRRDQVQLQVTAERAHAWVEAYMEGYGWITLESTPAYSLPFRDHRLAVSEPEGAEPFPGRDSPVTERSIIPWRPLLAALAGFLLLAALLHTYRRNKPQPASPRGAAMASYHHAVRFLERNGLTLHQASTPREYAFSIGPAASSSFLEELTSIYEKAAYGYGVISNEEAKKAETLSTLIVETEAKEMGLWRYLAVVIGLPGGQWKRKEIRGNGRKL